MADVTKSTQHVLYALVRTAGVTGATVSASLSVTVPSITDPDIAKVDVTVTGAAVGDVVLAAPLVALPTNCRFLSAVVTATDTVQFTFGSEGGNVTGAAKTFDLVRLKRS